MRLLPAIVFLYVVGYAVADIVEIIEEGSGEEEIRTEEPEFNDEILSTNSDTVPMMESSTEDIMPSSTMMAPVITTGATEFDCLPKLDLVFLLDTSGSLEQIYQEHVRWAVSLVDSLQIEPDAVQVAAVQYAGFPLTEFALGTYPSVEDIRAHLQQINFQSGVTRTGYALRKAEAELFREERGARKDALKVIILFTDGLSIDDPLKPAAQLREIKGVKIYVVSVSNDGFESEMSRIAGNKENVFGPNDLPRLRSAVLNDAERARACSQIGPSWLQRREKVTNKPTTVPTTEALTASMLKEEILPPLDFLNLGDDGSDESVEKPEDSNAASAVKANVDFDVDDKTTVLSVEDVTQPISDESIVGTSVPEVPLEQVTDVPPVLETMNPIDMVKIDATINFLDVAERVSPSGEDTTPIVPSTTEAETIVENDTDDNENVEKFEKLEQPVRAFAAPILNQAPSDFDEQPNDVFDLNDEERQRFSMTTPTTVSTTPRPRSRPPAFTRRLSTVETTSTSAPTTVTTVRTTRRVFTTRPRPSSTTEAATTQPQSTPQRRFRTTLARRVLSTVAAVATSTTTQRPRSTTRRTTTSQSPSTTPVTLRFTTPRRRPTTRFPPRLSPNAAGQCPMDVLFVVDSSGSVQKIYDEQKEYLMDVFSKAQIGDQHRVSLLQFAGSNVQKTEWSFDAIRESSNLMSALRQVRLITGTTYIGAALDNALQVLEKRRPNVPVIVILISDGFSQDDPILAADRIRQIGNMEFYSLSISELANTSLLAQMVGSEENVYVGSDANELKDLLIRKFQCK